MQQTMHMQPNDKIAFGRRVNEIALKKGLDFVLTIAPDLVRLAIDYFKDRPLWLPPDTEIDDFVKTLGIENSLIRGVFQNRSLPPQELGIAANYFNRLPTKEKESYSASAYLRLAAQKGSGYERPEALIDLLLFLGNKRRIHDGN